VLIGQGIGFRKVKHHNLVATPIEKLLIKPFSLLGGWHNHQQG
jgi:hypothetical protein